MDELTHNRAVPFEQESFRNNDNLRGMDKVDNIPLEDFKYYTNEIIKCKNDITYFANKYFTIVTPGIGKHVIKTYPRQDELVQSMIDNDRLCVLASRQVGKTTTYNIFALHICCFSRDKKILILGNKAAAAIEFLSRIKMAYEFLPSWLKPGVKEFNKASVEFSNGCKIEACATTPEAARGKSCDILIIDEMAFVPPKIMEDLWSSVYPIISSNVGTKVIVVSTPNGTGNMFHTIYEAGATNIDPDGWVSFKFLWDEVPGRDEHWRNVQIASFMGDMQKWNQEFGCEFLGSTNTLIPTIIIQQYKKYFNQLKAEGLLDKFTIEYCDDWEIQIFKKPEEDHCYAIGCDVADGVGGDATVIKIFDITNPLSIEEVAYFADKYIGTVSVPYILAKLGCMYNIAPILMESNNMGRSVLDILYNIFEYTNVVQYGAKKIGIHSSNKIKIEACEHLRRYMANIIDNKVRLKDKNLIDELEDFQKVRVGGNLSHTYKCKSKNDDHIMAAVWAFYCLNPDILDEHFDARYEYIGINRYPIAIKNFYSSSDVEVERNRFEKRVEETKKILQISEFNSFTLPTDKSVEPGFIANSLTPREELEIRMEEIRKANEEGDSSHKIFGFF